MLAEALQGGTHWRWWVECYNSVGKDILLSYNGGERGIEYAMAY